MMEDQPTSVMENRIRDWHHGEPGHYPDRTFEVTKAVDVLRQLATYSARTSPTLMDEPPIIKARKELVDAVLFDCYGRIFPTPNSAADFIPVIDPKSIDFTKHPELVGKNLDNCIALIKVGGKLAVVGGFNDIGESIAKTAGRELDEELGVDEIENAVQIGKASRSIRDKRFPVDATICSGVVKLDKLKPGDDAEKDALIIVKLFDDETHTLNDSYFKAGTYTDITGKTFTHSGFRADHKFLVEKLYRYWQKYGEKQNLTLDQTLKKMSRIYHQDWFKDYEKHEEGADDYKPYFFEGLGSTIDKTDISTAVTSVKKMLDFWKIKDSQKLAENYVQAKGLANLPDKLDILPETKNLRFAIDTASQILQEAGFDKDAKTRAEYFVHEAYEKNILPLFPQSSVSVDCLVVENDELYVEEISEKDCSVSYALPGSFFSPDPKDPNKPWDPVIGMKEFSQKMIWDRIRLDVQVEGFLVGAGGSDVVPGGADTRYPRLTNVIMARKSDAYIAEAKRQGHKAVKIPLKKPDGSFNDEIFKLKWRYGHEKEILQQFREFLGLFDPSNQRTAEQIVRDYAFKDSF